MNNYLSKPSSFSSTLAQSISIYYITVRTVIGPFSTPDYVQNAPGLPKTRSGKIMRRVLRAVAVNSRKMGDVSTLADESVIGSLFENRPQELKNE